MNLKTLRILAAAVLILVAASILIEMRGRSESGGSSELLFPDLKARINDVTGLTISRSSQAEPVVLSDASGKWSVVSRDSYPADFGTVRALLLAIADASVVEEKTANPEMHGRLGLRAPDVPGSDGVLVALAGEGVDVRIILGHAAPSGDRYARIADGDQTWLIDQDPEVPESAGDWLLGDLVDIDQSSVQRVTISHVDGESIHISKETTDDSNFVVSDIPEGRELSYSTVANGIAGALSELTLEDVRRSAATDVTVTTEFATFEGLTVTVQAAGIDDETWISLSASSTGADGPDATVINERVDGWQFKIPKYKAGLLSRRWEDILKATSE